MKNLILTLIFSLLTASNLFSQIVLEVGDGMQVEANNVVLSEASDIIENGNGYFQGAIESSLLTEATQFAGLTFSTGFTGTITRTTGSSYSKGNGEGENFKRYYELNNTDGNEINTNITVSCVCSGTNDETLGMNGPYFIYEYQSDWSGYGDGSAGSTVSAQSVSIPSGNSDLVISEGVAVSAKIYLEGPYNKNNSNMNTNLNNEIPLTSPYLEDSRTASEKPNNAVDWVLVQLKETPDGAIVGSRSAFIDENGYLVKDNGTQGIGIKAKPGDYYLVIKHRNHLAVMSASKLTGLTWGSTASNPD